MALDREIYNISFCLRGSTLGDIIVLSSQLIAVCFDFVHVLQYNGAVKLIFLSAEKHVHQINSDQYNFTVRVLDFIIIFCDSFNHDKFHCMYTS